MRPVGDEEIVPTPDEMAQALAAFDKIATETGAHVADVARELAWDVRVTYASLFYSPEVVEWEYPDWGDRFTQTIFRRK